MLNLSLVKTYTEQPNLLPQQEFLKKYGELKDPKKANAAMDEALGKNSLTLSK